MDQQTTSIQTSLFISIAILIAATVVAVAMLPVDEASAKECNRCKHGSNHHDHSTTTKDKTPFILSLPFP
jgi:hypothetical protein